jgi:hypothetical protein
LAQGRLVGGTGQARRADEAFLTLWENADVALIILQQAREELENLR